MVRVRGWLTPVVLPARLEDLHGPVSGVVHLPLGLYSSGGGPPTGFDVDDWVDRATLYSVVMENAATAEDLATWLDAGLLQQMWLTMWLSPHVRRAWEPLMETRSASASAPAERTGPRRDP